MRSIKSFKIMMLVAGLVGMWAITVPSFAASSTIMEPLGEESGLTPGEGVEFEPAGTADSAKNTSSDIGPFKGVDRKSSMKWVCTGVTAGASYKDGSFPCAELRKAGSCKTGDFVVGFWSSGITCGWRCAKATPVCQWQP